MSLVLNIFRVIASCTSIMMVLSPAPTVYRIHKTEKTGHMSIFPLIGVVFNSHTWLLYGYLKDIMFPVFTTSLIGEIIGLIYVVVYYRWSDNRAKDHRLLALFGFAIFVATLYAILGASGVTGQTREQVANCAGFMGIGSSLVMYASPLEKVKLVFKHKSAVFIPIQMVLMGTINNAMWVTYTSLASEWLMLFTNVATCSAGLFQVILYIVYNPKSHPFVDKSEDRDSTATTEDESEKDDSASPTPSSNEEDAMDAEQGEYVTIQTPTAARASPEMLV